LPKLLAILNLVGLMADVVGGFFWYYSLVPKASAFKMVKSSGGILSICLDGKKVVGGWGGPLVLSDEPCPEGEGSGPVLLQVATERPTMAKLAMPLIGLGFLLQLPAAVLAVL
jgi:hypothetical protein